MVKQCGPSPPKMSAIHNSRVDTDTLKYWLHVNWINEICQSVENTTQNDSPVPNCCKYKANGTRKEGQKKKSKPYQKKIYSEPICEVKRPLSFYCLFIAHRSILWLSTGNPWKFSNLDVESNNIQRVFLVCFSPHLCVGFLFLVLHSRALPPLPPPPPPALPPPRTTCPQTTYSYTTSIHTHNLLTPNLSTHNLLKPTLSTYNLITPNLSTHTHNLWTHTHTQLTHTQLVHT